jgi:hypothetical protein
MNVVQRQFVSGAGRVVSTTDALGPKNRSVPYKLNRVTTVTDALNGQTAFTYNGTPS